MDYITLWNEISTDPLSRGYAGLSSASVAGNLNQKNRTRNRTVMSGTEVLNAIKISEFNALTSASQARIWDTLHLGTLNPFGIEATIFIGVFGAGASTIATLQTLRVETISRGEELGLGTVAEGHVVKVRARFGG